MVTLGSRQKYVLHYRNLVQALKNGLILNEIHGMIRCDQSPSGFELEADG